MDPKPTYAELLQKVHDLQKEIHRCEETKAGLVEAIKIFREMAENVREVFWLFDWIEKRVIYASPAYESIWGRSVDALLHRYEEWAESIHSEDLVFARESLAEIAETGGGEIREYRMLWRGRRDSNSRPPA